MYRRSIPDLPGSDGITSKLKHNSKGSMGADRFDERWLCRSLAEVGRVHGSVQLANHLTVVLRELMEGNDNLHITIRSTRDPDGRGFSTGPPNQTKLLHEQHENYYEKGLGFRL